MRQLEAPSKKFVPLLKISRHLKKISFKQTLVALTCLASLSACTVVPNEGPTNCGLESMDNALFRDAGCDPLTGIISLPSVVLVWVWDYSNCGLKWHNSRIAADFDGKNHRYIRRLRQLKMDAERNKSALEAKRNLASQNLSENAIADRIYTILKAKADANNPPPLTMKGNQAAKELAENAFSEQFTIAFEQVLRIQSNLKLAQDRALAAMPQDEDLLPALADPDQKEASSYSVLELEQKAWDQVTAEDKVRRQAEKAQRLQEKMAKWSPERRAAYDKAQAQKAAKQQAKLEKKRQKQEKHDSIQADKEASAQAKQQAKLQAKGELAPVPMRESAQNPKQPPQEEVKPAPQTQAPLPAPAQKPVAPLVRKAETVTPNDHLKAQVEAKEILPIPLNKIKKS